jgi:hypothetical protein
LDCEWPRVGQKPGFDVFNRADARWMIPADCAGNDREQYEQEARSRANPISIPFYDF